MGRLECLQGGPKETSWEIDSRKRVKENIDDVILIRVEWIWLDNVSGTADEDEADITDIDFDSSPLLWVVGLGEGEDRRTS